MNIVLTQKSLFPALVKDRVTVINNSKQLSIFDLPAVPRRLKPEPIKSAIAEMEEIIEFDGLKIRLTESGAELI